MSFYDLATECEHALRTNEATTMSAISYLPAQVGTVKSALKGLGKRKGQWNLEILEDGEGKTVRFEDALEIRVPNAHWDSFQGIFDGDLSSTSYLELASIGLLDSIEESEESLLEQRIAEIRSRVEEKVGSPAVQTASDAAHKWISQFGSAEGNQTFEGCLIKLPLLEGTVEKFTDSLTEEHREDLGQLEILLKKLDDFQTIKECMYLAGVRVPCQFEGIDMVFEAHTGWDGINFFSIFIDDDEVADTIEEAAINVPRIGNVFYPQGSQITGAFGDDSIVGVVREAIEGTSTGDESNEKDS